MNRIVCELCGSTNFIKENGMYVCQKCQTKYSVEEARNLMKEINDDEQVVNQSTVQETARIHNYLDLAVTALESKNLAECESYCNKIIEISATNADVWHLKGKAVGWQSSLFHLRIEEATHLFCKSIELAEEQARKTNIDRSVTEIEAMGESLILMWKKYYSDGGSDKVKEFSSNVDSIKNSLMMFVNRGYIPKLPGEYLEKIATMINEIGVKLFKNSQVYSVISFDEYFKYLNLNIESRLIFQIAATVSGEDNEASIVCYNNKIIALKDSLKTSYIGNTPIKVDEKEAEKRCQEIRSYENKIVEIQRKIDDKIAENERRAKEAEEERKKALIQERANTYWTLHPEEKRMLQNEKGKLTEEIRKIDIEIEKLSLDIERINEEIQNIIIPFEREVNVIREKIDELERQRASVGFLR